MPTRSRRAAAAAAANQIHDCFYLPEATEATEEEEMLARLEAYRGDLAAQFQEHYQRLERRIKKDHESSTALSLGLSRLSLQKRQMPFLDFLSQEFGVGPGTGGVVAEVDENDPISERVKRSMKRKNVGSAKAGSKRARAKAQALDPVAEDEVAKPVPASGVRQTRARAAAGTPLSATTPLSSMRGANSANRAPATRGRGRAAAADTQMGRGLGRPLKEGEAAFSALGSPLINPFLLRPQDMRHLKRGDVSQLRKLMGRLEDLLQRA